MSAGPIQHPGIKNGAFVAQHPGIKNGAFVAQYPGIKNGAFVAPSWKHRTRY